MIVYLRKTIKSIFDKHPLIANCLTYGTFTTSAEFLQQTLSVNERSQNDSENGEKGYDFGSLLRYAFIGSGILSPMLYGWYKILDKRMPGTSIATSIKKSVIDVVGCGIPYYSAFYCGLSLLEGGSREQIYEDWKFKVLPTYLIGTVLWIPAQVINFKIISPQYRVAYVASLVLVEVNVLCVVRQFSPENINTKLMSFISEQDPQTTKINQKTDSTNQVNDLEENFCRNEDEIKSGKN